MAEQLHNHQVSSDHFLICGLGSLGQHCVAILHEFGVRVSAIDSVEVIDWELPQVPELLEQLWIGDCRLTETLSDASVQNCRAVLLVTSDERVNIEAAFAARMLNPKIRLVVRSAKQNFNQLLEQQLGNFVAFEPTQLSAPAFALAALSRPASAPSSANAGEDILGLFNIESHLFQITKRQISQAELWSGHRSLRDFNTRSRRVLHHQCAASDAALVPESEYFFYQWHPDGVIAPGDSLITVEVSSRVRANEQIYGQRQRTHSFLRRFRLRKLENVNEYLRQRWQKSTQNQLQRVVVLCLMTVITLWGLGTILFSLYYPKIHLLDAFYATAIMLLGGYGDLFSEFQLTVGIPWWLRLFGLGLTLAGTAFIGVLYALLTEKLLTWRLRFTPKRPPLPEQDHVIVIGLGRVGQRVVRLLENLNQPLAGIADHPLDSQVLPQMPLVVGPMPHALHQVNVNAAKSVVAVTEDEMNNLEMSLIAHAANPSCGLAVRTYDRRFTEKVAHLFNYAHVLCASALSAEAFAAAAFGENILGLFRLLDQTVLVTDYRVEPNDTLNELLLSEVAYGYGVVPIVYQRSTQDLLSLIPSEDLQLHTGDRLVVLATIAGLQRIEQGKLAEKRWQVTLEKTWSDNIGFAGATEIARVTGCSLSTARELMNHLPAMLPMKLYWHQAMRLVEQLKRLPITARAFPVKTAV